MIRKNESKYDILRSFEIDSYVVSIKLNDEIGNTSDDDLRLSIGKTSDIKGELNDDLRISIGKTSDIKEELNGDIRFSIGKTCEESSDIRGEVILLYKEHNGHKFVLVADEGKWECLMCGYYDGMKL